MNRRTFLGSASAVLTTAVAGCATTTRTAVKSEVDATAELITFEHHPNAVEATIEVTNESMEGGSIGLHIHFWSGEHLWHTHMPTVYVEAGETKGITNTFNHQGSDEIDRITVHVKE